MIIYVEFPRSVVTLKRIAQRALSSQLLQLDLLASAGKWSPIVFIMNGISQTRLADTGGRGKTMSQWQSCSCETDTERGQRTG